MRRFLAAFEVGDIPDDDATDEEVDAWANALADAVFPQIQERLRASIEEDSAENNA